MGIQTRSTQWGKSDSLWDSELEKERKACERGGRKFEAQAGQEEELRGRGDKGGMQVNYRERTVPLILAE